jgi:hypothetical protein
MDTETPQEKRRREKAQQEEAEAAAAADFLGDISLGGECVRLRGRLIQSRRASADGVAISWVSIYDDRRWRLDKSQP